MNTDNIDHEFFWRVISDALGPEKVAYLKTAPLHELLLNKMAQDYPEQTMPETITFPAAVQHIIEKHAYAKRSWRMVEQGIEAVKQLSDRGLYKRASLLPLGSLYRKLAARQRLLLASTQADVGLSEKAAAALPEFDRQLKEYLGPERFEKVAGLMGNIGEGASKAYKAVAGNEVGGAALKGLGYSAGAAVPAGALGYHLMGRAEDKAKDLALPMMAASAGGALLGGMGEALGERLVGG